MQNHSDSSVRIGDQIVGRCVTYNSIHSGTVTRIVQTPSEYATRFHINAEDGRNYVVFFQGIVKS